MVHQDFEKYASEVSMKGQVSPLFKLIFSKIAKTKKHPKILDFGCGDGKYFLYFKKFTFTQNIYGTEVSKIRIANCQKIGWDQVSLLKLNQKLPYQNDFFDIIVIDQVIEHIDSKKTNFYLLEIQRILSLNGILIIITPNYPIKRIYDFFGAIFKRDFRRLKDDPTHINHYNFKKLEKLLKPYFNSIILKPTGGILYKLLKLKCFSHKIIGIIKK